MAARKQSLAEAKAAKQKKIAIGGAVLLVGIMAFQGPKMLKLMSGGSSGSAAPAVAPVPVPVPGATPAPTPVSATTPSGTKLISFERFSSKDPFAAQVSVTAASTTKTSTTTKTAAKTATASAGATGGSTSGSSTSGSTQPSTFRVAPATKTGAGTVRITVNGKTETVATKADFPKADPTFTLAGIQSGTATISIAGGSLKTGGKTFVLTVGKPTTLLNTADGKRYTLELVSTAPQAA